MTFKDLKADVYRRCRYPNPTAAIQARIGGFLNEVHRELVALPGLDRLRDDTFAITAVANKSRMGLPPSIARIQKIVDRTNNHTLQQVTLRDLRMDDPGQRWTGGYPLRYAVTGYQPLQFQPASATGLWAVSTSASDTTQKVFMEATVTGGYPHIPATSGTTLTGTSRVQLGSRTDLIDVLKLYLDSPPVGFVSLYDASSSGNELARIAPGRTATKSLVVEWHPVQTTDTTLYVDGQRVVSDLVNDGDDPIIPDDFHYVLSLGARMKEYEYLDDDRQQAARIDYKAGQNALKSWVLNDGDRVSSLRSVPQRWSRLGGTYPADGSL